MVPEVLQVSKMFCGLSDLILLRVSARSSTRGYTDCLIFRVLFFLNTVCLKLSRSLPSCLGGEKGGKQTCSPSLFDLRHASGILDRNSESFSVTHYTLFSFSVEEQVALPYK